MFYIFKTVIIFVSHWYTDSGECESKQRGLTGIWLDIDHRNIINAHFYYDYLMFKGPICDMPLSNIMVTHGIHIYISRC